MSFKNPNTLEQQARLLAAIDQGERDTVALLLQTVDPNFTLNYKHKDKKNPFDSVKDYYRIPVTPLSQAIRSANEEMIRLLLDHNVNPNTIVCYSHAAILFSPILLLAHTCRQSPDFYTNCGINCLMALVERGGEIFSTEECYARTGQPTNTTLSYHEWVKNEILEEITLLDVAEIVADFQSVVQKRALSIAIDDLSFANPTRKM